MKIKHAFVTGATGFLGFSFIALLQKEGWEITAIHRSEINHPLLKKARVNWKKASLDVVADLKVALPKEPFHVFHIAADTSQWKPLYERQYKTNVTGTRNLIEAVKGSAIQRFIHVSSITAFGQKNGPVDEQTLSSASTSGHNYSLTKWKAEEAIREAVKAKNLDAVILNPCHIIGPWDTNNWIQLFKAVIEDDLPGIPPAMGNFSWVEEVAKALLVAVQKGVAGENYILGGPHLSMLQLINEIERQTSKPLSKKASSAAFLKLVEPIMRVKGWITGNEPQLTQDKVLMLTHNLEADDTKAKRVLGYKHKTKQEIVNATLAWLNSDESGYRKNNSL